MLSDDSLGYYMRRAIKLAKQSPFGIRKPFVGALVISDSSILVGEGCKTLLDGTNLTVHAERIALDNAGNFAKGGYLISTLEPCIRARDNQIFRPCAELTVERGIHTVVIGLTDNSPAFDGKSGTEYLMERGIEVIVYGALNSRIADELMPRQYRHIG